MTESFLCHVGHFPVIVIVNPKNTIIAFHVMIGEIPQVKPETQEEFVRQICSGMEHLTMVRIFRNVLNCIVCEYQIIAEGGIYPPALVTSFHRFAAIAWDVLNIYSTLMLVLITGGTVHVFTDDIENAESLSKKPKSFDDLMGELCNGHLPPEKV